MTMKSFTDIQLPDMTDAYRQVQEKAKKLDPVGKEDGDVDNDGDKDSSDEYLMKRRKAISKAMKKEDVEMDEATLATARKNIGRDPKKKSCWDGYKATGTKMKGGKAVPDCKKEEVEDVEEGYGKKKSHKCASKVKHEEWGMGDCIKTMHTLDEEGNVTHYDVFFDHGIEKNIPVENLEIVQEGMHEHVINVEKNQEINEISADLGLKAVKAADMKRAKLAKAGDKEGAAKKAEQAKRLYKKQAAKRLGK
tara:strand:- start:470 stop:1219 length:750 start_codon:yes stop_codon:yes gene_type:complete